MDMKKQIVLAVVVMVMAVAAMAQTSPSFSMRADVPFNFIVNNDTMPAGEYVVQLPSANPGPMMVRQAKGIKGELILQVPVTDKWQGHAQLVFHNVNGAYYLVEISDPRFGTQRVSQGKRYQEAIKVASAKTVVIAGK
jgi:hypothetical protein